MFGTKITRRYLATFTALTGATLAVVVGVEATGHASATDPGTATVTVLSTSHASDAASAVRSQATAVNALPACQEEDGSTQRACYWDAQRMGNGEGWSMIHMDYGQQTIMVSWLPATCKAVSQLPAYETKINSGAKIHTPSGVDLINEAMADGINGRDLNRVCSALIAQWSEDHAN